MTFREHYTFLRARESTTFTCPICGKKNIPISDASTFDQKGELISETTRTYRVTYKRIDRETTKTYKKHTIRRCKQCEKSEDRFYKIVFILCFFIIPLAISIGSGIYLHNGWKGFVFGTMGAIVLGAIGGWISEDPHVDLEHAKKCNAIVKGYWDS